MIKMKMKWHRGEFAAVRWKGRKPVTASQPPIHPIPLYYQHSLKLKGQVDWLVVCYRKSVVNQSDNFTAVIMLKDLEKKGLVKEVEQNIWIRMQTGEELHVHSQCHRTVVHTFSLWGHMF